MTRTSADTVGSVLLREIAYGRSGDKGNTSNVLVIPYHEDDYEWIRELVTVDVVRETFGALVDGAIHRYEFRGIRALNFVMERALQGGVSRSLALDAHGKSRANLILTIRLKGTPPSRGR